MAGQQIVFADTINGLKKAMSRSERAYDSDESTTQPTNRGNKLKRKATFVQEGRLSDLHDIRATRRKIEHAGYTRTITVRNPIRLDEDGDEIEDEDEDGDSQSDAENENPYFGIKLEALLKPLTSAAELPDHPSMRVPYYSTKLEELTNQVDDMVQKENSRLWCVKDLLTGFRGDCTYIPCGKFDPQAGVFALDGSHPIRINGPANPANEVLRDQEEQEHDTANVQNGATGEAETLIDQNGEVDRHAGDKMATNGQANEDANPTEIHDKAPSEAENPGHVHEDDAAHDGGFQAGEVPEKDFSNTFKQNTDPLQKESSAKTKDEDETGTPNGQVSHPMQTRAQAKAPPPSSQPQPPNTLSSNSDDMETVASLFTFDTRMLPDRDLALPPSEALDTRRLLLSFVQKQEEVVRGAKLLRDGLLRADRMRKEVLKATKAAGHLGEMSDGEDWYDEEEWGLDGPLIKGRDEEEEDGAGLPGKKTRQRRQ